MNLRSIATTQMARDPYGVVHLIAGVGYDDDDGRYYGNRWVAPCYAIEVKSGTWICRWFDVAGSKILSSDDDDDGFITCLGCVIRAYTGER